MKKLICIMGGAMLLSNCFSQKFSNRLLPLYIDGSLPDITFTNIIHYKDSTAKLSDFQGPKKKLVIFDFWNVHCSVCIAQFAKEDSLQKLYRNEVQFVMVAPNSKQKVKELISKWETSHHQKLEIPIITEDTILAQKYIRVFYNPQFAFIDHNNRLIAQASDYLLDRRTIKVILEKLEKQKQKEEIARQSRLSEKKKSNETSNL